MNAKNMRNGLTIFIIAVLVSCAGKNQNELGLQNHSPLIGTWELISGTLVENGDTTVTYFTENLSFVKIINETHFAFLEHDLKKGIDSTSVFVAGGGRYSLVDSLYTEHLEYCSDRSWEGNDFTFTVTIKNDTLVQRGVEKLDNEGINRLNIERYTRLK